MQSYAMEITVEFGDSLALPFPSCPDSCGERQGGGECICHLQTSHYTETSLHTLYTGCMTAYVTYKLHTTHTVHCAHCTLHTVFITLCTLCAKCTVHKCKLQTGHCIHCTMYTLYVYFSYKKHCIKFTLY